MPVDNSHIIERFVPGFTPESQSQGFIYTELIYRRKDHVEPVYNIEAFYHKNVDQFREQFQLIKKLCDLTGLRAYTRIGLRTWESVGKNFAKLVLDQALAGDYASMKSLYRKACALTTPVHKYWFYDVDLISEEVNVWREKLVGIRVCDIPSKTGEHIVVKPHDPHSVLPLPPQVELHKDGNVNLYIP